MSAPELPEFPDWFPPWLRYFAMIASGFGAGFLWLSQFHAGRREPEAKNVIITEAEIVDMSAVRQLTSKMERLSDELSDDHDHRREFRRDSKQELEAIQKSIDDLRDDLRREERASQIVEALLRDIIHKLHVAEVRDEERERLRPKA